MEFRRCERRNWVQRLLLQHAYQRHGTLALRRRFVDVLHDKRDSATERNTGNDSRRSADTTEIITEVGEMICSQEGPSRSHATIRETGKLHVGSLLHWSERF